MNAYGGAGDGATGPWRAGTPGRGTARPDRGGRGRRGGDGATGPWRAGGAGARWPSVAWWAGGAGAVSLAGTLAYP
ncbi:hypothetical protein MF672_033265 [Actinomadura sp. ATCC 31491]|uniref:Uncharacterized protein n=1 Tax=Actinomadura luzonensis TaxID=2805427 RepID=A0ABT0G1Z8_9ACTN|nr:hypothetical protein [Actinomadura luzonensis]MCK2218631.1 hypothetical protein [Actinomadura luzonensis]